VYEETVPRVMGQTLPELRARRPPEAVRASYESLAFALMERFAKGGEAPFTPPPASWIHHWNAWRLSHRAPAGRVRFRTR
jgi:hypothetical protein